ncbi:MAG: DEAD/DEAH box helicase family protein [Candidatus Nanohaloarchaea archaeon]
MEVVDNFDKKLVLKEFLYEQFGAEKFEDFRNELSDAEEGFQANNRSEFSRKLKESSDLDIKQYILDKLPEYDKNIQGYEEKLNRNRDEDIRLKYFQWLSLLFTEVYLDLYFNDQDKLWLEFSEFVEDTRNDLDADDLYSAAKDNLSKLAYWMATGSGKTLIMHANLWQYQKYGNGEMENVLLITPNEGLTQQHLNKFEASGIDAARFRPENSQNADIDVSVMDIHKLSDESGDKTYSVDIFEGDNLVFVDEGHKGAQGDTWIKYREQVIGDEGFSFEYSATFGQALNSINNEMLQNRYVQSIIFQYSFNKFHKDGFGKDYDILNLEDDEDRRRDKYLVANLLSFYEQKKYFKENQGQLEEFNIEDPLWIFVGQTVNATGRDVSKKQKASDVERVVNFLNRVLEEKYQVIREIEDILSGSEFLDADGNRLFEDRFGYLESSGISPEEIYSEILEIIFNADSDSSLTVVRLKNADGEIGLRVGRGENYFGLVSIGDTKKFTDRVEENSDITVEEQEFKKSLFDNIDSEDSDVNVLIGAKKFVEGWDSYRVSNMGLMRVGKSEGSEIIQIFGRGIRLKGLNNSLKRSSAMELSQGRAPEGIEILERLNVFGVEASYIEEFEDKLEEENIKKFVERSLDTQVDSDLVDNNLKVPRVKDDVEYNVETTDKLEIDNAHAPTVDLYPQVRVLRSEDESGLEVDKQKFSADDEKFGLKLVDWDSIFMDIVEYKESRDYSNTVLEKESLREIIEENHFTLRCPEDRIYAESLTERKEKIEEVVKIILRNYLDNFYKSRKGDWEDKRREFKVLEDTDPELNYELKFQVPEDDEDLLEEIEEITENPETIDAEYTIEFDRSLYRPLFVKESFEDKNDKLTVPAQALNKGERKLVKKLERTCEEGLLDRSTVYLLRNPRNRGIGFSEGGYPDFILWIKEQDAQKLIFIDPHGMVHEPDKLKKIGKVKLRERVKDIQKRLGEGVEMSSHVISTTKDEDLNLDTSQIQELREMNFWLKDRNNLKKILRKEEVIE